MTKLNAAEEFASRSPKHRRMLEEERLICDVNQRIHQMLMDRGVSKSVIAEALLSESEMLRVGTALSIAIAIASEHRFVLIDRVDALLPENRNRLVDSIEAHLPELDSVVMISAEAHPPFPGDETSGVYWIEGGVANALTPDQVAP